MEESFEITVTYKNARTTFPAVLQRVGYSYRIVVNMDETLICFEPDEERNFRVDDGRGSRKLPWNALTRPCWRSCMISWSLCCVKLS